MKKKIAILGSTGSIGKSTLSVVSNNINDFEIILLSTNRNIKEINKQCKKFKPRFVIINDVDSYKKFLRSNKHNIKVFNSYKDISKLKKKIDYTISAVSGFDGLEPTLKIIPYSKTIAIANKESLICGWNLIKKKIDKHKTNFIPIDSEHFSIWSLLKGTSSKIEKIYITASGGPFFKKKIKHMKNIKPHQAIKHPKWNMGKKISIDSATMVNKVFEVIEASKIFNINIKNVKVLSHPDSYVHAIVKFKNGLFKILIHDTNMKIPIFNSLFFNKSSKNFPAKLNISKLNHLNLNPINVKQFPVLNLIQYFSFKSTLFETVLISANDELVDLFLQNKIKFLDISKKLITILDLKEFKKYRSKIPNNLAQIITLNRYVRLKTRTLCVRSYDNA